ncbi:hypothetical protein GLP43_13180 [Sulfitobacter sp. M39]|uniref:hypothetical protein n=1 Tax=Sulfitobacter sp. M39 TaxID=2675334 RepID=UPI001F26C07F|nr:hypothetical protein [Sulfitobacter sp. M39]MCF7748511.1 hypothetical protein [Sulfitobacter sp. M39]
MNIRDLEMITLFVRLASSQQMEPICVRRENFFRRPKIDCRKLSAVDFERHLPGRSSGKCNMITAPYSTSHTHPQQQASAQKTTFACYILPAVVEKLL